MGRPGDYAGIDVVTTTLSPDRFCQSKPKIAQFLYEPGDGGLDRVAIHIANGFADHDYPSELWMARDEGPSASLISDRVTVRIVPGIRFGSRGVRLASQIPALGQMIRSHRPAVLLSAGNQSNLTTALANRLAYRSQTKIVQKITNPAERPNMGAIRRFVRRKRFGFTIWLGDRCLMLSEADTMASAKLYPGIADRLRPVRNPYVTPAMAVVGSNRELISTVRPLQLLAVGRIAPQKDYQTMLCAVARITNQPWRLTILGDGPLMDQMQRLAEELAIADRVRFAGFVDDPTPFLADADLFLLSSRWEGFPAAPLEAMAAGCDVVATDCSPGLSALLREIDRTTVPVGDPVAFSTAIGEAMAAPMQQSSAARIARRYSIDAAVSDHLERITDLLR